MVSVVMPAYNAEKTIQKSVESVISQTFQDWELIVIDDGSHDDTANILSRLVEQDNRIRFFQNEKNRGVSYTRNRAVLLANGEWIAFLDSDDLWMPNKLEKQLELSKKFSDMVVCYTASSFIDEKGNPYEYVMPAIERLNYKTLLHKNLMSCSSVMIRTSVMKKIQMPNDKMHEDYYVWLNVLRNHGFAYGINEPLLIYRLGKKSKSSNRFKSAQMLLNSYRAIGYNNIESYALVFLYTIHSVTKRKKIYSKRILKG